MTVISVIVFIVLFAVFAVTAYWLITKFIPEPAKTPLLAIIGVMLLVGLIWFFFPEVANYRIGHE